MSAIAGVWARRAGIDASTGCKRMLASQAIYGPDGSDCWNDEAIALGRCLRRLLPEDVHDRQPLIGAGGRLVLVADLRLDNREDLQAELNIDPLRASDLCDAALLLAAWEKWDEACLDHLVGDYAFALWDRDRRRLLLARDPFGARPLHYHCGGGFFAFASMPKGLHALPDVPRGPDELQILDFVALAPESGSRSFFQGIERVEPGSVATVTASEVRTRRYWRPTREPIRLKRPDDYVDALRHHLDQAVRAQLRGAGDKVGAHLSAGLDSSSVAATAARLTAPAGKVVAFTAVPREGYSGPEPRWRLSDEGKLAAETAAQYPNIEHVLVRTNGKSPLETVERDFYLYDRPLLNLCNFTWLHEINRLAGVHGVSVMLVGSNGNQGLTYDGLGLLTELVADGRVGSWFRTGRALTRAGALRWQGVAFRSLEPWMPGPLWNWLNGLRGVSARLDHYSAINPAKALGLMARARKAGRRELFLPPIADTFRSRIDNVFWTDPGNYRKGTLGGWGLDIRDPTSDRRLFEFCLNVPLEIFLRDGRPRWLATQALADRLPASVLDERRRGYQAADWHEGLTTARPGLAEMISRLERCPPAAAALDLVRMRQLVDHWPTGGWEREEVYVPYRLALLRGLSVGHFLHKASGSNA